MRPRPVSGAGIAGRVAVILSLLLHVAGLQWWLSRRAVPAPLPGIEQTVTVDLLAAPSAPVQPVISPAQAAPETAPAAAAAPEPEPLRADEMAEQHRPVKKPPAPRIRQQKPEPLQPVSQPVSAVPQPASNPVAQAAVPAPVSAARYDAAYLNNPPPAYPPLSRRLGEEGRVLLRVQVAVDGKALAVELKQSSGFPRLDEAASKAASRWRFVPARQGEVAVVSWVEVPVRFSLQK